MNCCGFEWSRLLVVIRKLLNKIKCTTPTKAVCGSEHHSFCYRCSSRKWRWQSAITQEGRQRSQWCALERERQTESCALLSRSVSDFWFWGEKTFRTPLRFCTFLGNVSKLCSPWSAWLMSSCCFNEQLLRFGAPLLERAGTDPLRPSWGTALTLAQDLNEIQNGKIK